MRTERVAHAFPAYRVFSWAADGFKYFIKDSLTNNWLNMFCDYEIFSDDQQLSPLLVHISSPV